jgi:hypothetical protein
VPGGVKRVSGPEIEAAEERKARDYHWHVVVGGGLAGALAGGAILVPAVLLLDGHHVGRGVVVALSMVSLVPGLLIQRRLTKKYPVPRARRGHPWG